MQQVVHFAQHFVYFVHVVRVVNCVVQFCSRARENNFHIAIYPKVSFVMIYIFESYIFEYTFLNFLYFLVLILRHTYSKANGILIKISLSVAYEIGK